MVNVILIALMLAFLVAGLVFSRRIRLTEYTSYRSRGSFSQILFSLLATLLGAWMFFGLSAVGYEAGILGYVIGAGFSFGLVILALLVPRIKRAMILENADTMDDFFGARYGKVAQTAVSLINLSFFLAVLAAQFIAMTLFLGLFSNLEDNLLFCVAVATVLLYTSAAGFKGVLFTDIWQFWIITATILIVFFVLSSNVDLANVASLNSKYFNATGYGSGFLLGVLVLFPFSFLVRTDFWQRVACAKDIRSVQRGLYACAPIILLFYIVMTTIGIYARADLGDKAKPDTSGLVLFLQTIGYSEAEPTTAATLFVAVFSIGLLMALFSTIDTNLNVVSVAISKLLRRSDWSRFEQETPDKVSGPRTAVESSLLLTARVVTVVLGLLGVVVAWAIPDIVNLMVGAASMLLVFIPSVYATVKWGARNVLPATVSIIAGYAAFLAAFVLVNPKIAFLPGVCVSFMAYFLLRLLCRRNGRNA